MSLAYTGPPQTAMTPSSEMGQPPVGQSPGPIPDLVKIGSVDTNTAISVDTDVLDPVVSNANFMRYRLQNKGILHSNSKLTFSVTPSGGIDAFYGLGVGVMSLIERCRLVVGTKTLCETQDFAHFQGFKSLFVNPEHNKQRESVTTARQMCRKWLYDNGSGADGGSTQSSVNASDFTIDIGRETDKFKKTGSQQDVRLFKYQLIDNKPVYQIPLSELFPFLKMNQLPLYMMKEEVTIELFFQDNQKLRACIGASGTADQTYTVNTNDCQMVADYIYYPQEMMLAYQNANPNMSFSYVDYRIAKHTITGASGTINTQILNVGGAGRVVNKVFFGLSTSGVDQESILNNFCSKGVEGPDLTGTTADRYGQFTHNIKYNDNLLYPLDITNRARIYHNIVQAEGGVPFVSKSEFTDEGNLVTNSKFMGQVVDTSIENQSFYIEDRLNRGERVNSRGIELYNTWNYLQDDDASPKTYTLRCWLEVVRFATLQNGYMTVGYA